MSGLRISGGHARGRVIRTSVGPGVRPTSSRVREALFSMVGQDLSGLRVLDAFAGSGLLGLEAWSRGAEVVAIERDPRIVRELRAAVAQVDADVAVKTGDVLRLLPELGPFDGILADPPYAVLPEDVLPILGGAAGAWLMYEADAARTAPTTAGPLRLDRARTFGGTALWLYRREVDDVDAD